VALLRDLLASVQQLHHIGLIHRDVKPENFIVSFDDKVNKYQLTLVDIGAAAVCDSKGVYERNVGTVNYISPESLKGWHYTSSDLYSACKSVCILMGCNTKGQFKVSSKLYSLLVKWTDRNPSRRGSVEEAIIDLEQLQSDVLSASLKIE
jgi:serine/threonine protein kinase